MHVDARNLFQETWTYIFIFNNISLLWSHRQLKALLVKDDGQFILDYQWHGYWYIGNAGSKNINNHGIELVPGTSLVSAPEGVYFV